jgi:DNA-directed RNA polymerase subunit RPC12/RpoP
MMILGFGIFLLAEDNYSVLDTMRASFNFNEKHRFKTFALLSIGLAFYLFLSTQLRPLLIPFYTAEQYAEWFNPATRNWGMMYYYDFSLVFLQCIFQPIIICLMAVQYVEISTKKELTVNKKVILLQKNNESELEKSDLIKLKEQNLNRKNIAHTIKSKGGNIKYFCPNCGQRILFEEKNPQNIVKCKNCGINVYCKS